MIFCGRAQYNKKVDSEPKMAYYFGNQFRYRKDSSMFPRLLTLPSEYSFFLLGPRSVGKSTLLQSLFTEDTSIHINLLLPSEEMRFMRNPETLIDIVRAMPAHKTHIIIDEIQKIPKLLDVVHFLIESSCKYFVMSGSSARKLKHGGANLLAGRAFMYSLHSLSAFEYEAQFSLEKALHWGTLPKVILLPNDELKQQYLRAYAHTYLKEEIWVEQFIKNLEPFRCFLEVAAQMNGKIINYSRISRDVHVDDKTVKNYYSILEDTLIGFHLNAFHHSFRKQLTKQPKFYFFDLGVTRALANLLTISLHPQTSMYGEAFEHFIICECVKLANYFHRDYRMSYLKTKDDVEIDLIVERPGKSLLLIEIKSAKDVTRDSLARFFKISLDMHDSEAICLCNDRYEKKYDHVHVLPWQEGLTRFFMPIE
jgi:predicted AAA+ superfamily ATPase